MQATGCEAQFSFDDKMYYPMQHNEKLGELYKAHALDMGLNMEEQTDTYQLHTGTVPQAYSVKYLSNVSCSLWPYFRITSLKIDTKRISTYEYLFL